MIQSLIKNKVTLMIIIIICAQLAIIADYGLKINLWLDKLHLASLVPQSFFVLFSIYGFAGFAFSIATVGLIEIYFNGYQNSSFNILITNRNKSLRDVLYFIFQLLLVQSTLILTFCTLGLSSIQALISEVIQPLITNNSLTIPKIFKNIPLALFMSFVGYDFIVYWQHRIIHKIPILWASHKVHHSAEEMTLFTWGRDTLFTTATKSLISFIPILFISSLELSNRISINAIDKLAMAIYFALVIFTQFNRFFSHSNLNMSWGFVGRYIFVSPRTHRIHHSKLKQHHDKNFGSNLIIWDKIFGTYFDESKENSVCPIGLDENPYNKKTFIYDYFLLPILETIKILKKSPIPKYTNHQI